MLRGRILTMFLMKPNLIFPKYLHLYVLARELLDSAINVGLTDGNLLVATLKYLFFPLPMSPWRPGARVGGRKMSHGAYRKLLCRLASEGHNLSNPVDLKAHWAKHGTNNFVTIK
ncbi:hypothetical protein R6Q59_010874 [Mikania micrantha]